MSAAVKISRTDHTAEALRGLAAKSNDGGQVRRLLALALILEGHSREGAADLAGLGASLQRPGGSGALLDPDRRASVLSERGANGGVEGGGDQRPRSRDGQSCPLALRRFS